MQFKKTSNYIYDITINKLDVFVTMSRFDYKSSPIFTASIINFSLSKSEEVIYYYTNTFLFLFKLNKFVHFDSFNDMLKSNPRFTVLNEGVDVIMKLSSLQKEYSSYKYGDINLTFDIDSANLNCNKYCYVFF